MKELVLKHHDCDENADTIAVAVFSREWTDAAICNTIRNALMAQTGLELDELDMDVDGVVERDGDTITVNWTSSRGNSSVTTLIF